MSTVAILYKNILESATSITPTDVNTSFPAYRLYDRDIGKLFKFLTGSSELLTEWTNINYDVFQSSGRNITSAQNTAGVEESANSNNFTTTTGKCYQIVANLTLGSGQVPSIYVRKGDGSGWNISDQALAIGVNTFYFTESAGGAGAYVKIVNTAACDYSCTFTIKEVFDIVIDQGADFLAADHLVIPAGHNLSGLEVKLQYSTTGAWAGEEVDALFWTATAALIDKSFTAQTKGYWRLRILMPAAAPELAEMFLGSLYTFETNPLYFGFNESIRRNIVRDETQSGRTRRVKFGDPREYRKYSLMIGATQKASLELWESTWEGTKSFYVWDTNGDCYFMELMNELVFVPLSSTQWTCELELLQVL